MEGFESKEVFLYFIIRAFISIEKGRFNFWRIIGEFISSMNLFISFDVKVVLGKFLSTSFSLLLKSVEIVISFS
jgi:hypothetical protein